MPWGGVGGAWLFSGGTGATSRSDATRTIGEVPRESHSGGRTGTSWMLGRSRRGARRGRRTRVLASTASAAASGAVIATVQPTVRGTDAALGMRGVSFLGGGGAVLIRRTDGGSGSPIRLCDENHFPITP